jgi:carboxymethylenebutenolidase
VAGEPDEARKLAMTMDLNRAGLELQSAVTFLQEHELASTRKVAVTGFCMGGALAYMLASLAPADISAVVPFYGAMPWPDFKPDWDRISAPIEGHYAEHDHAYPLERARELEADLAALGKDVVFHYYPGTSHAFFNPTRPEAFDATAAETSWRRTLAFLARTAA